MATSVEKVHAALQQLADADLAEAGVSTMLSMGIRSTLPLIRAQLIPSDPVELDAVLDQVARFCSALKSDVITDAVEAPNAPALEG